MAPSRIVLILREIITKCEENDKSKIEYFSCKIDQLNKKTFYESIKYDGILKSLKSQNNASQKQHVTERGTSFSWLFTRTTNMENYPVPRPFIPFSLNIFRILRYSTTAYGKSNRKKAAISPESQP